MRPERGGRPARRPAPEICKRARTISPKIGSRQQGLAPHATRSLDPLVAWQRYCSAVAAYRAAPNGLTERQCVASFGAFVAAFEPRAAAEVDRLAANLDKARAA